MKLLISIVPRDKSELVSGVIGNGILDYQTIVPGHGTATSEILEALCLGETDRDVLFSLVDDKDIEPIFKRLINELDFLDSGMGVAFAIPLDGISKVAFQYLYHELTEDTRYGK